MTDQAGQGVKMSLEWADKVAVTLQVVLDNNLKIDRQHLHEAIDAINNYRSAFTSLQQASAAAGAEIEAERKRAKYWQDQWEASQRNQTFYFDEHTKKIATLTAALQEAQGRVEVLQRSHDGMERMVNNQGRALAEQDFAIHDLMELLQKAVDVIDSEAMKSLCTIGQIHGCPYSGPIFPTDEAHTLLATLRAKPAPEEGRDGTGR